MTLLVRDTVSVSDQSLVYELTELNFIRTVPGTISLSFAPFSMNAPI